MKQVIAFWNLWPGVKYKSGQLLGTITVEEDGTLTPSPEDFPMLKRIAEEETLQSITEEYIDPQGSDGKILARFLEEGETPEDLQPTKRVRYKHVPGEGAKLMESYTIDKEGVWTEDA
jgi:hypothetical protein